MLHQTEKNSSVRGAVKTACTKFHGPDFATNFAKATLVKEGYERASAKKCITQIIEKIKCQRPSLTL